MPYNKISVAHWSDIIMEYFLARNKKYCGVIPALFGSVLGFHPWGGPFDVRLQHAANFCMYADSTRFHLLSSTYHMPICGK